MNGWSPIKKELKNQAEVISETIQCWKLLTRTMVNSSFLISPFHSKGCIQCYTSHGMLVKSIAKLFMKNSGISCIGEPTPKVSIKNNIYVFSEHLLRLEKTENREGGVN